MTGAAPPVSVTVAPLPIAAGVIVPDTVDAVVVKVAGALAGGGDVDEFEAASADVTR